MAEVLLIVNRSCGKVRYDIVLDHHRDVWHKLDMSSYGNRTEEIAVQKLEAARRRRIETRKARIELLQREVAELEALDLTITKRID